MARGRTKRGKRRGKRAAKNKTNTSRNQLEGPRSKHSRVDIPNDSIAPPASEGAIETANDESEEDVADKRRIDYVLNSERRFWFRVRRNILSLRYSVTRSHLAQRTAGEKVLAAMDVLARIAIIASPILLRIAIAKQAASGSPWGQVLSSVGSERLFWAYAGVFTACVLYSRSYSRTLGARGPAKARAEANKSLLHLANSITKLEFLVKSDIDEIGKETIKNAKDSLAEAVAGLATQHFRGFASDWQVNVFKFANQQCTEMTVCARSSKYYKHVGKPASFPAKGYAPYYSAKYNKRILVCDANSRFWNPFEGGTLGLSLRCKYFYPICLVENGILKCVAVISVASSEPFHFASGELEAFETKIAVHTSAFKLMLLDLPYRIEVEEEAGHG